MRTKIDHHAQYAADYRALNPAGLVVSFAPSENLLDDDFGAWFREIQENNLDTLLQRGFLKDRVEMQREHNELRADRVRRRWATKHR